jgi:tetratricopeptide (TPR) repeat protein
MVAAKILYPATLKAGGTLEALRNVLDTFNPHLIWFVGHGDADASSRKTLGFTSADGSLELFDPEVVANLLAEHAAHRKGKGVLEAVTLNSCETGGRRNLIGDLLHKKGIRFVLFWQTSLYDPAGPFMAEGFFKTIAVGRSYAQAYQAGCQCIQEQKGVADARLKTATNPHSYPPHMLQRFELVGPGDAKVVQPAECGPLDPSLWKEGWDDKNKRVLYKDMATNKVQCNRPAGYKPFGPFWKYRVRPGEEGEGRAAAGVPGMHEFETVHNIPFPPDSNYIDHKETGDSVGLTSRIRQMLHTQQGNGSGHGDGSGGGFSSVTYAALTQVAAAGLGGIGKTHAVIQVVHAEVQQATFDYILWVSAESAVTLRNGFERIAKEMLKLPVAVADGNTDKCRKLVLDWMQTTHSRWLLVLDNADNTAAVKEYLPMTAHEGCGHVVLTTRTSEEHLKQQLQRDFATLTVTKLSDVEAKELLLRGTSNCSTTLSPVEVEALEGLVEALDGLPLALAQARDYMAVNKSTFVEYKKLYDVESMRAFEKEETDSAQALRAWLQQLRLEKYQAKLVEMGAKSLQDVAEMNEEDLEEVGMAKLERMRFMRAAAAGVEVPMQTKTVARTWRISFDALTAASQQLLECLSLLAPDDIPDTLVPALARAKVLAGGALSKSLRNADGSDCTEEGQRLRMNRLLNDLTQYSLVQRRTFSGSMSGGESGEVKAGGSSRPSTWLSMHRLVQQVQRDEVFSCNNDVGGAIVGVSAGVRAEIVWGGCVQAMAVVFKFDEDLHETWQQSYGMGVHAESLLGLHMRCGTTGCLLEAAGLASTLSHAFCNRCEYGRARAYYEQALAMYRRVHGAEAAHAAIATVLSNLGSVCRAEGDSKAARKYYKQSLAMYRRVHGAEAAHADIANVLSNLGIVCRAEGDSKAARKYYEQSLAMHRRVHGAEAAHADIAHALMNLGNVCSAEGDSKAARKYYEQPLAMYRRVHSAEAAHAHIAHVLMSLGNVCSDEGDSKAARRYYEQSLAMHRRVHGAEAAHAHIAHVLTSLGTVCSAEGDSKAARRYHEQSLAMYRRVHGAEAAHADIANVLLNLGIVCSAEGDSKAARKYHEQSLAMHRRVHGAEAAHADIAIVLRKLGCLLLVFGDFKAAKRYGEEALLMYTKVLPANHPDIQKSRQLLVICEQQLQQAGSSQAANPPKQPLVAVLCGLTSKPE